MKIRKTHSESWQKLLRLKRDLYGFDWHKLRQLDQEELERGLVNLLKSPYLYLTLGLVVGLVFTMQLKTESKRPLNPVLFYNELADLKKDVSQTKNTLLSEIKKGEAEIAQREKSLSEKDYATRKLFADLSEQQLLAGETAVVGSGLEISLSDGEYQIKDEEEKSLTHAADLRDIVNLLWFAGAEAISINDERIVANTSIDCIVSTILINTNNYGPPFTIKAIGNKSDLYGAINGSRKLVEMKKRATKKQISLIYGAQDNIRIEEYSD